MTDAYSWVLFFGGIFIFSCSLYYAYTVRRNISRSRELFIWQDDPRIADDGKTPPFVVVEGPRGKAEIYELGGDRSSRFSIKFGGQTQTQDNIEDAYASAGKLVGANKT
jgi:hypothetical protein